MRNCQSLVIVAVFILSGMGCATIQGSGEDLQAAGKAIEETAEAERTY